MINFFAMVMSCILDFAQHSFFTLCSEGCKEEHHNAVLEEIAKFFERFDGCLFFDLEKILNVWKYITLFLIFVLFVLIYYMMFKSKRLTLKRFFVSVLLVFFFILCFVDFKLGVEYGVGLTLFVLLIKALKEFIKKRSLNWSAATIFVSGYILYFIGFYHEGTEFSVFAMLLRPMISSMEMFVAHSDLLEVDDICKNSPVYMTWFAIVHFCAIVISLYVVLHWIYQRFEQKIEFEKANYISQIEDLYIFFDTNDAAWTLAKSIETNHCKKDKNRKYKIILVDEPKEFDDEKEKMNFIDLLNIKSFRKSTQERIKSKELKDVLFICSDKNISSEFSWSGSDKNSSECKKSSQSCSVKKYMNLWKAMGLEKVLHLITKSKKTHIFLFSEDAEDNLKAARNLLEWKDVPNEVDIYCKARYNERNSIYEEYGYCQGENNLHIHIVDDSRLAVLSLKKNSEYQPVQYVEIDKETACVKTSFDALILGFGQTGRDAFRYLYEYATFPGVKRFFCKEERSPLKIHVYDKKMETLQGGFLAKCPALREGRNAKRYEFNSIDVNTLKFWDKVKSLVNEVNYVVVALGDDDTNISLAVDLFKFALRYRSDISKKFDIFVRLYTQEKEKEFEKIKKHLCETKLKENNDCNQQFVPQLIPFGGKESIYSYDVIVQEETLKNAQIFAYIYNNFIINDEEKYDPQKTVYDNLCELAPKKWNEDRCFTLADAWNRMRQHEQDITNSWHIWTKIKMMQEADILDEKSAQLKFIWSKKAQELARFPIISKMDKGSYNGLKKDIENVTKYLAREIVNLKFYEFNCPWEDNQMKYNKDCQKNLQTLFNLIQFVEDQIKKLQNSQSEEKNEIALKEIKPTQIMSLENIAKCEHLRWNALTELQGYMNCEEGKDIVAKKHHCLCPWETLKKYRKRDFTRIYDYNIVLGSLLFYLIKKNEKR